MMIFTAWGHTCTRTLMHTHTHTHTYNTITVRQNLFNSYYIELLNMLYFFRFATTDLIHQWRVTLHDFKCIVDKDVFGLLNHSINGLALAMNGVPRGENGTISPEDRDMFLEASTFLTFF